MSKFSERYGYVAPNDAIIKEDMPQEIINAFCSLWDYIRSDYDNKICKYIPCEGLEIKVWCHFLNLRRNDYYNSIYYQTIIAHFLYDEKQPWYKKLDLIEFVVQVMFNIAYKRNDGRTIEYCEAFVKKLNAEFERLHYGYRIVDKKVTPITSEMEIQVIEDAISASKNNIKEHLSKAIALFADRESPDYVNSIKESISAVEAFCRELTGKDTLGKAINELEKRGIKIQAQLKDGIKQLYAYTNQPDTGIRHSLMDANTDYRPSYNEAYFMLVSCSAFINYLKGLTSK